MTNQAAPSLFDVVAIDCKTDTVRVLAKRKPGYMAEQEVDRLCRVKGLDKEFFSQVPAGLYKDGERWKGR